MKAGSVYTEERTTPKVEQRGKQRKANVDYVQVAESSRFRELLEKKKKFILPLTIFFLVFYFSLPILTSYTNVLERPAIGDISWAWIYASAQFIMTWVLCTVYVRKFLKFDVEADEIIEKEIKGGSA
ncbi:hypothetical protein AV656_06655 [Bhargavaea cecembensis]|uniref:DUF485 domain-containing protein n=1 Tax=Bhargavaea cecembensis TaxID=394098 RepID=A0A161RFA1_9BACL|nr:DUF485 domain-containing protein [Bhargavaea cecembensis]KZE38582.1 hypothetical protein AV656_06655 [Bhargavaea cecembensis]